MPLTCIIVEDEALSRKSLYRLCQQHDDLQVLGAFESASQALEFLSGQRVDLLWLDVEMPEMSGFELLEQLSFSPFVVMTTNKTEYAFNAFRYKVTDFLQKPITLPFFETAVAKVKELYNLQQASVSSEPQDIYVKSDGRFVRLPLNTIAYIENIGDYVKIVTNTHTHIVYMTMKHLEEKLNSQFLRVHRSYIVHLRKIVDIEENTIVIDGKVIPVSRANRSELMSRLNRV